MTNEIKKELTDHILPFWESLRDDEFGGYYGYLDYDLKLDKKAVKGCILMSRITWFFSSAAIVLKDPSPIEYARHGFDFIRDHCIDREMGGIYWSVSHDGKAVDTTKHTYNQAFAIYALSTYYDATGDMDALTMAEDLYRTIETRMRDDHGYLEAFRRDFTPESNEKLSENGVIATRTMNTALHVLEAYTEFYRVTHRSDVKKDLIWILNIFADKIWNPARLRDEVFFDADYNSLIDLYSYGHDIETAWLVNRALDVLDEPVLTEKIAPITKALVAEVTKEAFDGRSIPVECEKGVVKEDRVWWVQAEAINGYLDAYARDPSRTDYLENARAIWNFIEEFIIDQRPGSEWFWYTDEHGVPAHDPIVEPWKCPYHNGRMCLEVISRSEKEGNL
ncbi:MAG: AGE family epimerase/isomerase [Lachnospiraceae bacterium]|nr:AGE family epimerase/isomerase [Lachnospiraceae bacterium]